MRCVVQRVSRASVAVDGEVIASVGVGLLLLVGVTHNDSAREADAVAQKVANLRVFPDDDGKMNRSALDVGASAIVVSQFTLYGDIRKGRRPSFIQAAQPDIAAPLVERVVETMRSAGVAVQTGRFGAEMLVELVNDGPVTIWIDSDELPS